MKRINKWKSTAFFLFWMLSVSGVFMTGCEKKEAEWVEAELSPEPSREPEKPQELVSPEPKKPERIFVDVCGAVAKPGVYQLKADSRVFQAIQKAGGFLPQAAETYVNQAESLGDGQQIYIPTEDEVKEQSLPVKNLAGEDGEVQKEDARVNLNTADAEALMTLSGIGQSKADAILAWREENGGFSSIEDILKVQGIKDGTFQKIKDKIEV